MTDAQRQALANVCARFDVPFRESDYAPTFDLPSDWVAGWLGGADAGAVYVGCSPSGEVHS